MDISKRSSVSDQFDDSANRARRSHSPRPRRGHQRSKPSFEALITIALWLFWGNPTSIKSGNWNLLAYPAMQHGCARGCFVSGEGCVVNAEWAEFRSLLSFTRD